MRKVRKEKAKLNSGRNATRKAKIDKNNWNLRLYIAGQTTKSIRAIEALKELCEKNLIDCKYKIEVIDLLEKPQLAKGDQIIAVPTLVRKLPKPLKKIIGDLSDIEKVLVGLDLIHIEKKVSNGKKS